MICICFLKTHSVELSYDDAPFQIYDLSDRLGLGWELASAGGAQKIHIIHAVFNKVHLGIEQGPGTDMLDTDFAVTAY